MVSRRNFTNYWFNFIVTANGLKLNQALPTLGRLGAPYWTSEKYSG